MNIRPKVLFLIHLPPPIHGAAMAGAYIKDSYLINHALETTYINLATNRKLHQSGKWDIKKLYILFRIARDLIHTLRSEKFDICHVSLTASGTGFYKDLLMVFILKSFRCSIIYHFHNKGVANASKITLNRILYEYVFKNTQVILLSSYLYKDVEPYVDENNIFYCPYGIPDNDNLSKRDLREPGPCKFLYLSNMIEEKGVYVLLNAIKVLVDRGLNFRCDFVGGWADITAEDFNRKVQEYVLNRHVFVHGPKYGRDKLPFLSEGDVLVFPTYYHYETFGIVNLEAMQHLMAIISTPEGGIPDIIVDGSTGFLVPQRDHVALANKMELFIHDPEKALVMGRRGRERFERLYTVEKFESRMVEILKNAARRGRINHRSLEV